MGTGIGPEIGAVSLGDGDGDVGGDGSWRGNGGEFWGRGEEKE